MKLVKEYINEKFVEKSDPIWDMGIGKRDLIERWLKQHGFLRGSIINDDFTIDYHGMITFSHTNINNFPDYIQFNVVDGDFSIQHNNFTTLKGCPKIVKGTFSCSNNLLTSLKYAPEYAGQFFCHHNSKQFTRNEVLKYCKTSGYIHV